jgi:putative photosynthetic complex assembly protein
MAAQRKTARSFPQGPLLGAGALILLAMAGAVTGRIAGPDGTPPPARAELVRDLRFADRDDGAVVVTDMRDNSQVAVMVGQNGFLRGTLRGLARTRRSEGIGPDLPFRLTGWSDGRLTLSDPSTGRAIELEAFGSANEAVFARLLTEKNRAS